jgi:hypothetical protein
MYNDPPQALTDLSVDGDVEDNQKDEGDDTMDKKVEVNEINLDVERVKSQRCRGDLLNLKIGHDKIFKIMMQCIFSFLRDYGCFVC